jgi:acetate kinase
VHQPYNLALKRSLWPDAPQVACFDTRLHRSQSAAAKIILPPCEVCGLEVQRSGFHGLSYEYIASVLPRRCPGNPTGRVIVAHVERGAASAP